MTALHKAHPDSAKNIFFFIFAMHSPFNIVIDVVQESAREPGPAGEAGHPQGGRQPAREPPRVTGYHHLSGGALLRRELPKPTASIHRLAQVSSSCVQFSLCLKP